MHFTPKILKKLAITICLALVITMLPLSEAKAEVSSIAITKDGGAIQLTTGQTAQFQTPSTIAYEGDSYTVTSYQFSADDTDAVSVDANGKVTALKAGYGEITVDVYVQQPVWNNDNYGGDFDDYYDDDSDEDYDYGYYMYGAGDSGMLLFCAVYEVSVMPDLSHVGIDKTSQTGYSSNEWYVPSYTFHLKSNALLSEDDEYLVLSCKSSNPDNYVYAELYNNVLTLTPYKAGKTTVTVSLNHKVFFKIKLNTIVVKMTTNSVLMTTGQTKKLTVHGCKASKVKWTSSNPSVVSVSSSGKIKGKKNGNAVIKAKVGDYAFGCAVSVVPKSRKRAINKALYIYKTSKYSQAKRMQNKFYDCSSLVWRSYANNGVKFGNTKYAPSAAEMAKWCVSKKKMLKGGVSQNNLDKMKINAGDIMFESGANNGRYKGVYHVEMVVGYVCEGFDYNGKPILALKWATRLDGEYGCCGQMIARP